MRRHKTYLATTAVLLLAANSAWAQLRGGFQAAPHCNLSPGFRGSLADTAFSHGHLPMFGANPLAPNRPVHFPALCPPRFPTLCCGNTLPVYVPIFVSYGNGYGYGVPRNGAYAPVAPAPPPAALPPTLISGPAQAGTTIRLDVWVPADAEVWVGDQKLAGLGIMRRFVSGSLTPGIYTYEVTMRRWKDEQPVTETRKVIVQSGDWRSVDFTQPNAANAGRSASR